MRAIQDFRKLLAPLVFLGIVASAGAQFKVAAPAPYTNPVARQKIKELLQKSDPSNRQETIHSIQGLLVWYRDILDDELIAAWQRNDGRPNLAAMMNALADARIAASVIEFSWRQQRPATFTIAFAPMFVDLMTRSPDAAKPFFDDLLASVDGTQQLALSQPEADAVCRILLDLPDIRNWRRSALRILSHYRSATEALLAGDMRSGDAEKRDLAQVWMNDLRLANAAPPPGPRRPMQPSATAAPPPPASAPPPPAAQPQTVNLAAPATPVYNGPTSGTLHCSGSPVPQNAEYVFRNVPPGNLQIEIDTKIWEARLAPGEGQSQKLILKNKSSGPQKRCTVHWSIIP